MTENDDGCDSTPLPPPLPLPDASEGDGLLKKRKTIVRENEDVEEGEIVPSDFAGEDEDDDDDEIGDIVKTIGKAVRVSGTEDSRRFHFNGFEANGVSYELEDTVLVIPVNHDTEELDMTKKPSVAIIKDITATQEGNVTVTGQMFHRPEIAENGNGENWKTRELYYSFDKAEFGAELVMHKCRVHFIAPNKNIPSAKEYPGFIVRKVYDSRSKKLSELTDSGYEDCKRHEIDFLVRKTIAQIPKLGKMEVLESDPTR